MLGVVQSVDGISACAPSHQLLLHTRRAVCASLCFVRW
jgi:hypothetical protein